MFNVRPCDLEDIECIHGASAAEAARRCGEYVGWAQETDGKRTLPSYCLRRWWVDDDGRWHGRVIRRSLRTEAAAKGRCTRMNRDMLL